MRVRALDIKNLKRRNRSESSICERTRVAESSISEIRAPGLTEVSILTSRVVKSRKKSEPFVGEDACREILSIGDSDIGSQRRKSLTLRVAKSREDQRPSI
jgi:hypothetical protein